MTTAAMTLKKSGTFEQTEETSVTECTTTTAKTPATVATAAQHYHKQQQKHRPSTADPPEAKA